MVIGRDDNLVSTGHVSKRKCIESTNALKKRKNAVFLSSERLSMKKLVVIDDSSEDSLYLSSSEEERPNRDDLAFIVDNEYDILEEEDEYDENSQFDEESSSDEETPRRYRGIIRRNHQGEKKRPRPLIFDESNEESDSESNANHPAKKPRR
jgi:hypothetical protein